MFFVYILNSIRTGRYYIGSCIGIQERIKKHNSGIVKSTKHYLPWKLIYQESYQTLSEARKRELQIKNWKSRLAIERLIKHF